MVGSGSWAPCVRQGNPPPRVAIVRLGSAILVVMSPMYVDPMLAPGGTLAGEGHYQPWQPVDTADQAFLQ